jgi:ferredoxin
MGDVMAITHFRKSKGKRKTYHMVLYYVAKHEWIKAVTISDVTKLKKTIEKLSKSERREKLGLTAQDVRFDYYFQRYTDHVKLHNTRAAHKKYRAALNAFLGFLRLLWPKVKYLAQITSDLIEDYQKRRLESVELKIEADGARLGTHRNKRLPLPQTVNYEVDILRSVFIWARDKKLIPDVPTKKVKKLKRIRKLPQKVDRLKVKIFGRHPVHFWTAHYTGGLDCDAVCADECKSPQAILIAEKEAGGKKVRLAEVNTALCNGCGMCVAVWPPRSHPGDRLAPHPSAGHRGWDIHSMRKPRQCSVVRFSFPGLISCFEKRKARDGARNWPRLFHYREISRKDGWGSGLFAVTWL